MVTPCPEGVSVMHPEMTTYAALGPQEIDAAVRAGRIPDLTAGALAMAAANVRQRAGVYLVSDGISDSEARALGFTPFDSIEDALAAALAHQGQGATVSVLPYAPDTLPLLDP